MSAPSSAVRAGYPSTLKSCVSANGRRSQEVGLSSAMQAKTRGARRSDAEEPSMNALATPLPGGFRAWRRRERIGGIDRPGGRARPADRGATRVPTLAAALPFRVAFVDQFIDADMAGLRESGGRMKGSSDRRDLPRLFLRDNQGVRQQTGWRCKYEQLARQPGGQKAGGLAAQAIR